MLGVAMEKTIFLNIDLDIESEVDLSPIVKSFGENVSVMRNDEKDGVFYASFETGFTTISDIISEYSRLVENLDSEAKDIWNKCKKRRFDFGYECGIKPYAYYSTLSNEVVAKIYEIGGEIGITIYAYNEKNT